MHCFMTRALAAHALVLLTGIATAFESTSTLTITKTVAWNTRTSTISQHTTNSTPTPAPTSDMPGNGVWSSLQLQSAVLNSTNFFRSQYLATPLSWNSKLASFAANHARKCIWEHSGGPYGENLALNYQNPAQGVDAWAAEEKDYRYPNEGFTESTGHWTQLVWQNTTHVGCAATNCNNQAAEGAKGWFLVCEYDPAGNVEGNYLWNVQKPGESEDGKLGFGAPSAGVEMRSWSAVMLVVLVTVSSLAATFL